jgi:hypothetical protein
MQTDLHHFLVRASQREMKKAKRIEQWVRRVPERLEHYLLRDFRGASPIGMASHAIDHYQQARVFPDGRRHSILIVLSISEKTDVGVFDLQEGTRVSVRLCGLYNTLTLAA